MRVCCTFKNRSLAFFAAPPAASSAGGDGQLMGPTAFNIHRENTVAILFLPNFLQSTLFATAPLAALCDPKYARSPAVQVNWPPGLERF
jgi:hypothetical protein